MGIHACDAIVLRQYPYRETSVLVSCLTDKFGKIKGLIKGLRGDERSRFRSSMESVSLNHILFYDTRSSSLHLITQCELLRSYHELVHDVEDMRLASHFAELADSILEVEEPAPLIFELLKDSIERVATCEPYFRSSVKAHFVLRLLRLAGFHPQLDECAVCAAHPYSSRAFWSLGQGGLLCEKCLHEDPNAEPISNEWLEELSMIAQSDSPLELNSRYVKQTETRLDDFLRFRIEKTLKTMKMVTA